jgi:hypothetical protein
MPLKNSASQVASISQALVSLLNTNPISHMSQVKASAQIRQSSMHTTGGAKQVI